MSIGNYSDLQTSVAGWLARDDLTARVPDFITLAEAKFNRELRCIQAEKRSYTTVDLNSDEPEFIALPSDFQTMRSLRLSGVDGKPRLDFMNITQMDEFRACTANSPGRPQYFCVFGSEIELARTPDQEYELEMIYRANIPALASNSTNWLLTLAPDAYLYGALLEAAPYMKEDSRIPVWTAGLTYVLDGLNRLSTDKSYGSGPMNMRVSGATP